MWKIKKIFFNIIIYLSIALILIGNTTTYATEMISDPETGEVKAVVTQEDAGEAMATFAKNFASNYGASTIYGYAGLAYEGKKVGMKYQLNEEGWISFVVHNSLNYGTEFLRLFVRVYNKPTCVDGFEFVLADKSVGINSSNENLKKDKLTKEEIQSTIRNGDMIFDANNKKVAIYVGGDIIYCDNEGDRPLKQISLFEEDNKDKKTEDTTENAIENSTENSAENSTENSTENSSENNQERKVFKEYSAIARMTKEAAASLKTTDITTLFDEQDDEEYGKYYGTTKGSYIGTKVVEHNWLFSKVLGFFEYLFGIMALIIRAPFIGWANIIENMINDSIIAISGVSAVDKPVELGVENAQDKSNVEDDVSANDSYLNNRVNIEDIFYNNVPLLDADIFDIKFEKYGDVIKEDSILYKIKSNIAIWYVSIRNVCIVGMLMALIYLGIRLAIASTGDSKAKYKEMLIGWVTSFIMLFFIHYIMIVVFQLNEKFLEWLRISNLNANGGLSLYDTVRTRAYSIKLSEGIPATMFYIILIYYLIRFLSIYIRRYFTLNVLVLLGPVVALRSAIEKISTGKNKSSIMASWLTDFSLNVFLQTIHALIYTMFMVTAYEMAMKSVAGFVVAIFYINFIFKAEAIVLKVFKFNDAASLEGVADPNNNYFIETYALARGALHFTGSTVKAGYTVAKEVGEFAYDVSKIPSRIMLAIQGKSIEEYEKEQKEARNAFLDELNDLYYKATGEKSLHLELPKIKDENPELYKNIKAMLEKNRKDNMEVLKRSLSNGVKPIKAMAGIMTSIPLITDKPEAGILAMYSTISNIRDIANKREDFYGHRSKKNIRNRRGRVAANIFTAGVYGAVANNLQQFNKDIEKVRKKEEEIENLRKAQTLENEIDKEMMRLNAEEQAKGLVNEKTMVFKEALNSVMRGNEIRKAIKSYMILNNISELTEHDVEGILKELNVINIDKELESLINSNNSEIKEIKDEVEDLKKQAEEIKERIKKISVAIDKEKEDEEKQKQVTESNKEENAGSEENKTEIIKSDNELMKDDLEKQLKETMSQLSNKEEKIKKSEKEVQLAKETEKEIKNSGILNSGIIKDKKVIKKIIQRKMKDAKNAETVTAQQIVEEFNKQVKNNNVETYATKETVKNRFIESDSTTLDKKKATDAILDAMLKDGNNKVDEDTTVKYGEHGEYKRLYKKARELQVLNEKNKNKFSKPILSFRDYKKKMKEDKL